MNTPEFHQENPRDYVIMIMITKKIAGGDVLTSPSRVFEVLSRYRPK
jgi:hypothetical protein